MTEPTNKSNSNNGNSTERPENWPEHYHGTPTPQCDHHMMWDTEEGKYVCIYECGKTADEPPENKIESSDETNTNRGDEQ